MAGWLLGSPGMERCSALPETGESSSALALLRKAVGAGAGCSDRPRGSICSSHFLTNTYCLKNQPDRGA